MWLSTVEVAGGAGPRHYLTALLRDLSAERSLHEELRALQQRLRAVFELAPVAVWIAENDRIVFANRAAMQLFGAQHSLLGESVYALLRPESHAELRRQVAGALAGAAEAGLVHGRLVRADGDDREVEIALAALPDHGRTTVQMVITDVTDSGAAARELERSAAPAAPAVGQRRRGARGGAPAHRARAARRARPAADGAEDGAGEPRRGEAGARRATRAMRGMLDMLDETVASVRRIAGDLRPLMLDDLGLNAAIEWLARDTARRIGIGIRVRGRLDDPPRRRARRDRAVPHGAGGADQRGAPRAARRRCSVELRRSGERARAHRARQRRRLSRAARQREGRFGLLGMRERADMLGGAARRSTTRRAAGACWRVRLPLARRRPVRADQGDAVTCRTRATLRGGLRILIVDDHTIVREGLKRILEGTGEGWHRRGELRLPGARVCCAATPSTWRSSTCRCPA